VWATPQLPDTSVWATPQLPDTSVWATYALPDTSVWATESRGAETESRGAVSASVSQPFNASVDLSWLCWRSH
jgi:hypothetical protein